MTDNRFLATITCRNSCDGIEVGDKVTYMSQPSDNLDGVPEFVLLIHGYNDHRSYAECAYGRFVDQCDTITYGAFSKTYKIVKLHWPGDQLNALKGDVDYPASLKHAIASSSILATFIQRLAEIVLANHQVLRIHWFAHSLGNRLMLETIEALRAANVVVQFPTVVMLAAAVRSKVLEQDTGLRLAATASDLTAVLHSTGDRVLEWAFPPGQTISGDGLFPEALGRHGNPLALTHQTQAFNWFGHSDYWFSPYSVSYALASMGIAIDRQTIPNGVAPNVPPHANTTPVNNPATRDTPLWIPSAKPPKFQNPCPS